MKGTFVRTLALGAVALLVLLLPACTTYDEYGYPTSSTSVGVAVYGGYYGPGYVGGCCYGPPGGVVVAPPIHGGGYAGGAHPAFH